MSIVDLEQGPGRPSMKERQRQFRQDAILDAAVELIQTKGFNSMTLEDITEAIGISRPTLYQHFSSKEDVLIHIGIRNMRMTCEKLTSMDPSRPATDRLREFISWSIDRKFGEHREMFYDMTRLVLSCGGGDPRLAAPQIEFMGKLESLVEESQKEGGARADVPAMLLAEVVIGAIKSIAFNRHVQEGRTSADGITEGLTKLLFNQPER